MITVKELLETIKELGISEDCPIEFRLQGKFEICAIGKEQENGEPVSLSIALKQKEKEEE